MKRLVIAVLISAFAAAPALAADAASAGKACAVTKKPLAGAAKMSHMKSCCTKAANAAKLKGAAKTSFVKACEKGA